MKISDRLFPDAKENIEEGRCVACAEPIREKDFRDTLSIKEFQISGLCQTCQDEVFS